MLSDDGGDNPPPPEKTSSGEGEATKQEDKAPPPTKGTEGTEDTATEESGTEESESESESETETESTQEESAESTESGNGEDSTQEDEVLPPAEPEDETTEETSEDTKTEDTETEDAETENAEIAQENTQTAAKTDEVKTTGNEGTILATEKTGEGDSTTKVMEGDVMPHGFDNSEQAAEFAQTLNDGLDEAGYPETQAAFQGSSVTGVGYATGRPFGDHSDYDVALGGDDLFNAAQDAGVELRADGTRTAPLTPEQIDQLGLSDMHAELEEIAGGREVNFMVFQNINSALARSPSMLVPRR